MLASSNRLIDKSPFIALLNQSHEVIIQQVMDGGGIDFLVRLTPHPKEEKAAPPEDGLETLPSDFLHLNAKVLVENEEYILARNIYSALLRRDIRDVTALGGLGKCLVKLGSAEAALKCFTAAREISRSPSWLLHIAQGLAQLKQHSAALDTLNQLPSLDQLSNVDRLEYLREKGNCLARLSQWREAETSYLSAIQLDPRNSHVLTNLGMVQIQQERSDRAIIYLERALEGDPKNSKALCALGLAHKMSGNWAPAENYLLRGLCLDASNPIALTQLVEVAKQTGHAVSVLQTLERIREVHPHNVPLLYSMSAICFEISDWKRCEDLIHKLLEVDPRHRAAIRLREEISANKLR